MEETYKIKSIILNRDPFREKDSKVVVYTKERGKLSLVVRGTKSLRSKLAGHIEPFNAIDAMVVRGKRYEYLAGASTRQVFSAIKSDLDRLELAGKAIGLFSELVREGMVDDRLFMMLYGLLDELNGKGENTATLKFIYNCFVLKFYAYLGYSPVLDRCVVCGKVAVGSSYLFDHQRGGIICTPCAHNSPETLPLSPDNKKLMQYIMAAPAEEFIRVVLYDSELDEFAAIIDRFTKYHKPA